MILILYLVVNMRCIDRLIIPKKAMKSAVFNRAIRHFAEAGVFDTKDRTGILIFISELEQRVELIADRGINEKISQKQWKNIVKNLTNGIKNKDTLNSIIQAVTDCGELLAKHFPIQADDINEIDNEIAILEK
jgi:putative membrane protein